MTKTTTPDTADIVARIAELEAALDSIETSHGITDNGNLWRFWAGKAREVANRSDERRSRIEALEAESVRLTEERNLAFSAMSEQARARGEAEGRLQASELAGVVHGWKARAERAEAGLSEIIREADSRNGAIDIARRALHGGNKP